MELIDPNSPFPERNGEFSIIDHATERDEPEEEQSYHPDYLEVRFFLACGTIKKIFLEEREQVVHILEKYEDAIVAGKSGVMSFPGRTSFSVEYAEGKSEMISRDMTVVIPIDSITLIEADLGNTAQPMELVQNERGQFIARFKNLPEI